MLVFEPAERPAVGFAVSKRLGRSVRRNRARRRARELFRLHQHELPQGIRLILVALPGVERIKYEDLEREFQGLVGRLRKSMQE